MSLKCTWRWLTTMPSHKCFLKDRKEYVMLYLFNEARDGLGIQNWMLDLNRNNNISNSFCAWTDFDTETMKETWTFTTVKLYFSVLALSGQILNFYGCSSVLTVMNRSPHRNSEMLSRHQIQRSCSTLICFAFACRMFTDQRSAMSWVRFDNRISADTKVR